MLANKALCWAYRIQHLEMRRGGNIDFQEGDDVVCVTAEGLHSSKTNMLNLKPQSNDIRRPNLLSGVLAHFLLL